MYLISIYDNNELNCTSLAEKIKSILITRKVNKLSIMQISDYRNFNSIPYEISDSHFLFISPNMPNALNLAKEVSINNPFCKIVFYGKINAELDEIIACRPTALLKNTEDTKSLNRLIENEFEQTPQSGNYIFLETKKSQIIIPVNYVIYFTSEGHYVNTVYASNLPNERFKYKLDSLQAVVCDRVFIRSHKSYLVSFLHISKLDKKHHMLIMDNGEELPVSDYYYKDVIKKIRQFCPLKL